jgi:hypothetical protein
VPDGHFLSHLKKKLAVSVVRLAQQSAKLVEVTRLFTNTAPRNVIRRFTLGQVRQFRWFLAFVKQLIERALRGEAAIGLTLAHPGSWQIVGKWFFERPSVSGKSENDRINTDDLWWAWVDLNHRPRPYQGSVVRFYNNIQDRGDCQTPRKS